MNEEYKPIYNLWKDSKGYRYFGTLKLSSKIKYDGDDFIPLWEWVNQLKQENKQLNNILTELEEWLKETRINSAFIDEQTIMEVQLKIQELQQGSNSNE